MCHSADYSSNYAKGNGTQAVPDSWNLSNAHFMGCLIRVGTAPFYTRGPLT